MGMTSFERAAIALIAFAIVALAWMAVGRNPQRLRLLALVTASLTFALVVFGAYVRLSDAGLGCPDWPGCYGDFTPALAQSQIADQELRHPTGPVSMHKAWKEMTHRYLAMLVGCLILAMALIAIRLRRLASTFAGHAGLNVAVVALQGAFGALTVTMLLKPAIVTLHLLGGMSTLALVALYFLRLGGRSIRNARISGLRKAALIGLALLAMQIALGGWVSANYAASICGDLPTCQGLLLPPMDFSSAFHILRELGKTADGANLSMQALTAIQMVHRGFAILVFCYFSWLAWRTSRVPGSRALGLGLCAALALQIAIGISVVAAMSVSHLELPLQLPAAAAHNAGAALLLVLTVVLNFRAFSARSS